VDEHHNSERNQMRKKDSENEEQTYDNDEAHFSLSSDEDENRKVKLKITTEDRKFLTTNWKQKYGTQENKFIPRLTGDHYGRVSKDLKDLF
jgi:hypothetical protein